jgi:hypothetical protein
VIMQASPTSIPVFRDVDVLIVGASSGAVAAALELHSAGRTVMLVGDRSYFGEETAGALHLWPGEIDRSDSLVRAMFPSSSFPAAMKRTLESALLGAGIPFLFLCRPVAILRDPAGAVAGAVLAARTSLLAVRCRVLVDATRFGLLARLAGLPLKTRQPLPRDFGWTVLADQIPRGWEDRSQPVGIPFVLGKKDQRFSAFQLRAEQPRTAEDLLTFEHRLRTQLMDPSVFLSADAPPAVAPEFFGPVASASDLAALDDRNFRPAPDFVLLNSLLPLADPAQLDRIDVQIAAGRRAGKIAAAILPPGTKSDDLLAWTGGSETGDFYFAPAFLRRTTGTLDVALTFPSLGHWDVVVAGGGTGGAPAGISAARAGAKTLVLEIQHGLGGVGTLGLITLYWFGNRVGFTAEVDDALEKLDPETHKKGAAWSPELKMSAYHRMLDDAGGTAWLGSFAFGVRMEGERVAGLLVSTPIGCGVIGTGCVVDATGSADVAAAAGAPCRVIGADHVAVQGVGLSARSHPGVRYQNSDHTFIDDADPEGVTHAHVNARAKFPGTFDTSPLVDSRERRQIRGDIELSPLDLLAGRTFPDTLFTAMSNFDTHGFVVHPVFLAASPDKKPIFAHVPFRCMLPRGIDGLLVTGLGMSAHRDALPVIRMQADVQNQGYGAGLAAATAARTSTPLRRLDIRAIQRELVRAGVLAPEVATHEDSFPMSPQTVREAAAGNLSGLMNVAILLSHAESSRPLLLAILRDATDPDRRLDAAVILGLMGEAEAAPVLYAAIRNRPWDEGWNYRGMGQFGASMSRLDVLIAALSCTPADEAVDVIEEKIRALDAGSHFSHCRAVAMFAAAAGGNRIARALADLLRQPGMQGHAQLDSPEVVAHANADPVETGARNLSLRELHLARGLFLAGDVDGLGRTILENYADDLRGHYARHARALLAAGETGRIPDC